MGETATAPCQTGFFLIVLADGAPHKFGGVSLKCMFFMLVMLSMRSHVGFLLEAWTVGRYSRYPSMILHALRNKINEKEWSERNGNENVVRNRKMAPRVRVSYTEEFRGNT